MSAIPQTVLQEKRICLNRSVLTFMESKLTPEFFVLEFGSGWSSRWLADRCGRFITFETDRKWADAVRRDLQGSDCDWDVQHPDQFRVVSGSVNLVLVDSIERNRFRDALMGWEALEPGGWLILDDAQRVSQQLIVQTFKHLGGTPLTWSQGDIEFAKERLAIAWQRPFTNQLKEELYEVD